MLKVYFARLNINIPEWDAIGHIIFDPTNTQLTIISDNDKELIETLVHDSYITRPPIKSKDRDERLSLQKDPIRFLTNLHILIDGISVRASEVYEVNG